MIFTSWPFALFGALTVLAYWTLVPRRGRPYLLIAAGIVFYGAAIPAYLVLIGALAAVTYGAAAALTRIAGPPALRRTILAAAVVAIVGVLAYFKYAHFLAATIAQVAHRDIVPLPAIVVPLAISFFTFEFVHVVADAYRGTIRRLDPLEFAVFALFFPTLVAGPIKRYDDFAPQVRAARIPPADEALLHLYRVGLGCVKKLAIADSLIPLTAPYTGGGSGATTAGWWIATVAFTLKIYFDFTGYSDIAIGVAGLLGFRVPENFERPLTARNIALYRRRWHASLATWVRDYVFHPLGGTRGSGLSIALNILLAMGIVGLWHGAGWGFVLWGLWQGVGLVAHRWWTANVVPRVAWLAAPGWPLALVSRLATFVFVALGTVFFAARSAAQLELAFATMFRLR